LLGLLRGGEALFERLWRVMERRLGLCMVIAADQGGGQHAMDESVRL
jgi:hypothetical protein